MGRAYNLSSQPVFPKATAPHQGRAPRRISTGSSRIVRSPDNQPSRSNTGIPRVPNTPYNRARRVLVPSSRTLPLITLSMRADAQFFDRQQRHRISSYSLPFKGDYCHVEDACIIGDTAIVGYSGGPCQISLIRLIKDQRPTMTELRHMPHSRPANHKPERKGVVHISCLGPGPSEDRLRIYTGGYDKTVRLWSLNEHDATSKKIIGTAAVPLAVAHRNQTVLVSEGQQLLTVDLKHSISKPQTARLSNTIHHIHINPDAENVSILEVRLLSMPFLLYLLTNASCRPCP
ncbi:hypothetical protein BDN72DRAFT_756600 [Pluteus cervinus]|uniref:Uncharacterized protein n=1 Tax=Pluteus cervinus TaxID=181527 RepID=A0ACD3BDE1_9AGAR|nr:hypothetical protein BDN72DRAFT_756600 [Pluteus cervinus]